MGFSTGTGGTGNGSSSVETTQPDIENIATTEATTYVSPRRFWQGIARFLALAWTWAGKQTFAVAPRFSSVIASKPLKVDANKDLVSGDIVTTDIQNNAVTNTKLAQMPANSVKVNATGALANAQDLVIPANTVLGRDNLGGNLTGLAVQDIISATSTLVIGTHVVSDPRLTAASFCTSIAVSSTGVITSVPIRWTAGNTIMTFSTGQITDTAMFGYTIYI